jgi:hypothetical protein
VIGLRRGGPRSEKKSAEARRENREQGADEKGGVVAGVERPDAAVLGGEKVARPGRGDAGEHGEPQRTAHHERGVDDAGRQAGFARLDVTHRGEQYRVERDPGAEPDQDHAREHVDGEMPADRRTRAQRQTDGGERKAGAQWVLDSEAHHELCREAERERPHDQVRGQEGETDLKGLYPRINCRYRAERKNQANIAPAQRNPTPLAVARLRSRKSLSGTRGDGGRGSPPQLRSGR